VASPRFLEAWQNKSKGGVEIVKTAHRALGRVGRGGFASALVRLSLGRLLLRRARRRFTERRTV
jgi:hypothetical protein